MDYLSDFTQKHWIFCRTHTPRLKFLTPWEVVSEAMHFLSFSVHAQADVLLWLANASGVTNMINMDRADFAVYRTAKRQAFKNQFA